jgi:hypothetical protein
MRGRWLEGMRLGKGYKLFKGPVRPYKSLLGALISF